MGELKILSYELSNWLGDSTSKWEPIMTTGASKSYRELQTQARPGVFSRPDGLVAFVVPKGARLADCEASFRAFAVSSDLILGSTGTTGGELILIGRQRQLPFNTLPPLEIRDLCNHGSESGNGTGAKLRAPANLRRQCHEWGVQGMGLGSDTVVSATRRQ